MALISWLHGCYMFTTIVGVGVTAIDMLGLLGEGHGDHDGGGDGGAGVDHGGDAGHGGDAEQGDDGGGHGSLLFLLRYLRIAVYFSLGFGPLGLVAEATGASPLGTLAWAIPGGGLSAWLAYMFFRWQQRDVDSTVQDHELLAERALVMVSLSHRHMGRIRLKVGQSIIERYALAEDEGEAFRPDEVVEVVRVTDDCVYVRRALGRSSLDTSW